MGIKGWLAIGAAALAGIAVLVGVKKKEDEHYEKIQKIIRDVDRKKPENKEEPTEKIINDIEQSFREMGLDKNADDVLKAGMQTLRKANEMLGDSEMNRQKQREIEEKIKMIDNSEILEAVRLQKENEAKLKELKEKQNDPEWIAEQERIRKELEEKAEADYKRKVKKAVEQKNWLKLESLFDGKYAGGPWNPSPATVFGEALNHGDISSDIYEMAAEHYGKLWMYSGD